MATVRGVHMRCPQCKYRGHLYSVNVDNTTFVCDQCGTESALAFKVNEKCFVRATLTVTKEGRSS